jgi:hypothetical protein
MEIVPAPFEAACVQKLRAGRSRRMTTDGRFNKILTDAIVAWDAAQVKEVMSQPDR